MKPEHAAPIGTRLSHDYFSPGTSIMRGKEIGSPWVIAYYQGQSYRYERSAPHQPWVRVYNSKFARIIMKTPKILAAIVVIVLVVLMAVFADFLVTLRKREPIIYTMYAGTTPVTGEGKVPMFVTIERQWNGVPSVVRRLDGLEIRLTGGYMLVPANEEMLRLFHPELKR